MRFAWCALMGALFTAAATSAAYADLVVTAPGVIHNGGITDVIAAFTKSTGVKVKLNSSGMGGTADSVNATGDKATDVVFLPEEPNNLMGNVALDGGIKGGYVPVGRALFGLAVRAGDPHPDISTPEKFVAVLKGAKEVMISPDAMPGRYLAFWASVPNMTTPWLPMPTLVPKAERKAGLALPISRATRHSSSMVRPSPP